MAMKVLHNSCNMCTLDLTDIYALALGPVALMLMHTYQSNHSCTCYDHNTYLIIVYHKKIHLFDGIQVIFIAIITIGHLIYTKGGQVTNSSKMAYLTSPLYYQFNILSFLTLA